VTPLVFRNNREHGAAAGALWRQPDFLRLWTAETISQVGTQLTIVAIPLIAALTLHATPFQMGLLTAAGGLPRLLVGLVAGVWVDRLRHKPIMVAADLVRAAVLTTIPVMAALGHLTVHLLLAVTFTVGMLDVFFNAAWVAFLPILVGRKHLGDANGKLMASGSVAQIAGPALGGSLIALITGPVVILLDAVSFVCSAFLIKRIMRDEPTPDRTGPQRRLLPEIKEGLRALVHSPILRAITASSATITLAGWMFLSVYVLYMADDLGLSARGIGLVYACGGAGSLIGTIIAVPVARWLGLGRAMFWAAALFGLFGLAVPLALFVPAHALPLVVFAEFSQWLTLLVMDVNRVSLRQAMTPDRLQGRVSASSQVLIGGMQPIGSFLGGALGQLTSVHLTLFISCLGMFCAAAWLLRREVFTLQTLPTEPEPIEEEPMTAIGTA
jgi:MFS family permease